MRGPFSLSTLNVDLIVPLGRSGVYGLSNDRDSLETLRRTTYSVREEVKAYENEFKYFWFDVATSEHEAYCIETEAFHCPRPKKAEGIAHPRAPVETGWHCPVCRL